MHKLNEITYEEISRLGDVELSSLLLRLLLLESEAKQFEGIETVVVPLKINVGDGGEDGRVKCNDTKNSKWVLNKFTLFQCKATDLSGQNLYEEFFKVNAAKETVLKEQIEDVLDNGGHYTFFIRKDYNQIAIESRVEKANEAIEYANKHLGKSYTKDQIRIIDGNQIAIWVNEHISAVVLVLELCQMSRPYTLRTWAQWNETTKRENKLEYSIGAELKNRADNIVDLIAKEKVVRIIGHSGIGKTRFILETFSPDNVKAKAFSNMLVYIDLALVSSSEVVGFVINNINYNGLIVLDNCNESTHSQISAIIKSTGKLKLITIDHCVETNENIYYKIDKQIQTETIDLIIKKKYQGHLPDWVVLKLIELADGYPKMADYICDSVDKDGYENIDLTLPQDEILNAFIKKLIFGHRDFDKEQYSIIKACSIFKEFGFIDHSIEEIAPKEAQEIAQKQIDAISSIACIPSVQSTLFYSTVREFKNKREIVDRKGYSFYVRPEPLASNLAADWLLNYNINEILIFANKLSEAGLLDQFCLRLQSLDQIPRAKLVVEKLWKEGAPFSSAEVLNTEMGSRLFRSVVEVNPEITAKSLRAVIAKLSIEEIKNINKGRRHLIWAIEKLLYREEAFYDAAKTLLDFSVAENESIGNNATNQFLQLYHIYLSATVVDFNARIEVLKYGLSKNHIEYNRLVILALGKSLKGQGFNRMGGAEKQGLNKVFVDYQPKNWQEVYEYWKYSIETLSEFALRKDELSKLAMDQIASSIRTLFTHHQIDLITESIKKIYSGSSIYWEDAIRGLNWTLKYAELDEKTSNSVNDLLKFITPTDITNQFKMFVSKPEWASEKNESGTYKDIAAIKLYDFVKEIKLNGTELKEYFYLFVNGEQRQGFNFGVYISEIYGNQLENGKLLLNELRKVKKENQNAIVLGGLISKSSKEIQQELINITLNDPLLIYNAFYLIRAIDPVKEDVFKLFNIIDKDPSSVVYLNNILYGRGLDNLNVDEVIEFCEKITEYGLQGKWVALSIINQYCYNNEELWQKAKPFIKKLITETNFFIGVESIRTMDAYYLAEAAIKILRENDNEFAKDISKHITDSFEEINNNSTDSYFKNICEELVKNYFEIFWNAVSLGILRDGYLSLRFTLGSHNGSWGEKGILFQGNNDLIIDWCKQNKPKGTLRIAYMMPIYENNNGKTCWHPFALKMINEFGSEEGFLRELSANLGSFGSVGSSIEYYETQIELIKELLTHNNFTVKDWAKSRIKILEKTILREKIDEEAQGF